MKLFNDGKCIPAMFVLNDVVYNKAHPFPYVTVELNDQIIITRLNSFGKKSKEKITIEADEIDHMDITCTKGFNGGIGARGIVPLDFYLKVEIVLKSNEKYAIMNSSVMMIKKLCSYLDEKHIQYRDIDHLLELLKDVNKDEEVADILLPLYKNFKHFI